MVLDCLAQRIDAFGAALDRRFSAARLAASDGFFAAFAQATLEGIPAPADTDCAVADHDRISSGGYSPFRRGRGGIEVGLTCCAAHGNLCVRGISVDSGRSLL